jgi:hypothetical protein
MRAADARHTRPGIPTFASYSMMLGDDAGADGAAAFADGEAQLLFHRDRHDQLTSIAMLSPGITISVPSGSCHDAGHVGGAEVELRPVVGEERRVTAALLLGQDVGLGLELGVRRDRARLASTWPRSTSSRLVPRSSAPTLSPAWP